MGVFGGAMVGVFWRLGVFGGPLDRDFWRLGVFGGFWRLGIFGIVAIAIVVITTVV